MPPPDSNHGNNQEKALSPPKRRLTGSAAAGPSRPVTLPLPPYGDLTDLNTSRLILDAVGSELLAEITGDVLELLETSVSVYETNGDYALHLVSSPWCRCLDQASRQLCGTSDNREALASGKWHCHESGCHEAARRALDTGEAVDVECRGGLRVFAVPIRAGEEMFGSLTLGYGDPPSDPEKLHHLAATYGVSVEELRERAAASETRPASIIELAKQRLLTAARLLGGIIARQRETMALFQGLFENAADGMVLHDLEGRLVEVNRAGCEYLGYSREELRQLPLTTVEVGMSLESMHKLWARILLGEKITLESRHRRRDGTTFPVELRLSLFEYAGRPHILGVVRNITERKEAEEALRESEARYRSLFQNNHSVMLLIDPATGALRDANPAACAYYGFSREELVTKNITDLNTLTPEQVLQEMEKAKLKKQKQFEFRHRLAHGEIRDVKVFSGPIRVQGQELLYSIIHDITEQQRALRALEVSEKKYRSFYQGILEGCVSVDMDGNIIEANQAYLDMLGYTAETIRGLRYQDITPPQWHEFEAGIVAQQILPRGYSEIYEKEYIRRDGTIFPIEIRTYLIKDETGAPTGMWGFIRDITERKRMQEALEKRLVALSRPLDDTSDLDFCDLFNLPDIQQIQDLFAALTGTGSLITAPDGTPLTRPSNFCRLCSDFIRQTELGRRRCAASDAALGQYKPDGPIIQHCLSAGLCGAGASLTVGGKHIANWLIGQVRDETVSEENIRDYARELGVDAEEFVAAFREVPIISNDRFLQVAQALFVFANQLSAMAYQNVQQARFITERQQAEAALRASEHKYRSLYHEFQGILNAIPDVVCLLSPDLKIVWTNEARIMPMYPPDLDLTGQPCYAFRHDFSEPCEDCLVLRCFRSGKMETAEATTRDGLIWDQCAVPIYDDLGDLVGAIEVARNITARKRAEAEQAKLEAQMQEVQKLESLGVLAGGIAHDFNNLLMAILGNADLALLSLSPASPARPNVEEIARTSQRAADLCRQMLAYSGKGRFLVGRYDLSEIVREMAQMLEVSISKKASLRYSFGAQLPAVEADATQLRQVIMNLITNASEALHDHSGSISIVTGVMDCDRTYLAESYLDDKLPEGRYVYLEVSDTGAGMDEETRRRIFDPFFTTKFTGRGLGLAAVLGIVRGHKGAIKVYSEPGRGTTFKVLLPAVEWQPGNSVPSPGPPASVKPGGTVLLVDDDSAVRTIGVQMLERLGYTVLTAADGREGLEVFRTRREEIACVILDLTMPEMGGDEVFRELRRLQRDVRVILTSGYNEQEVIQQFAGKGLAGFVQKPYTVAKLRETLHGALAQK